jgi:hypothetical protein
MRQRGKEGRGRGRKISSRESVSVDEEARVRRGYESNQISSGALVAHYCNPTYIGGKDKED